MLVDDSIVSDTQSLMVKSMHPLLSQSNALLLHLMHIDVLLVLEVLLVLYYRQSVMFI